MITFSEIIGLQKTKSTLQTRARLRKVPHTQLFTCIDGGSGLALALAQAKMMACDNPSDNDSCGTCVSCKQFNSYNYPELHFSFPIETKGAESSCKSLRKDFVTALLKSPYMTINSWRLNINIDTKQLIIPVKEAADIIRSLSLTGFGDKPRIFIIWQPEKMSNSTANKLLKSLEEPGPNTYFMLISHNSDKLLSTIKSRCINVSIPGHSKQDLEALIKTKNFTTEQLSRINLYAEGSIGRAIEEIENMEQNEMFADLFVRWTRIVYSNNYSAALTWSEEAAKLNREQLKLFLQFVISVFRQATHIAKQKTVQIPFQFADFTIERFVPYINIENIDHILNELERCRIDIERNGNGKIIMLDASLKLSQYIGKA